MNEIRLAKWERRTCITEGLACYFTSLFLFSISVFSRQNIELLCYSETVGTLVTSALSWDVVHLRKQTMVYSDQ